MVTLASFVVVAHDVSNIEQQRDVTVYNHQCNVMRRLCETRSRDQFASDILNQYAVVSSVNRAKPRMWWKLGRVTRITVAQYVTGRATLDGEIYD